MPKDIVYDPVKDYKDIYFPKFHEKVLNTYDNKIKATAINVDANRELLRNIEKLEKKSDKQKDQLAKLRRTRTWLIVLCVIVFIPGFIMFDLFRHQSPWYMYGGPVLCILAIVGFIVTLCVINPKVKELKSKSDDTNKSLEDLQSEGYKQMYEYNLTCDSMMFDHMFKDVLPGVELDPYVDYVRFAQLEAAGADLRREATMCIGCKSGTINKNPFMIVQNKHHYMGTKTYWGETYVEWDEVSYNDKGEEVTEHKSQTLRASVTKPYPEYGDYAKMYYYCTACKELSFSRTNATGFYCAEQKDVKSYVAHNEKKLRKAGDKAVKDNSKFTPMANIDFETLFQAWNRNSEVNYRLIFTSLAQNNMCKVITDTPYKDDFTFDVSNGLTTITSKNIFDQNLFDDRYAYIGYSVDRLREFTSKRLDNMFANMYYALSPLLAIPAYQQAEPDKNLNFTSNHNFSPLEVEEFAHMLPQENFLFPNSATQAMLHTVMTDTYGDLDVVTIRATSYYAIEHVDTFMEHCDNGNDYPVDVHWLEYIPQDKLVHVALKRLKGGDKVYNSKIKKFESTFPFAHVVNKGVLAMIGNEAMREDFNARLDDFFDPLATLKKLL